MTLKEKINRLGGIDIERGGTFFSPVDNLSIVLATHFSDHPDRPPGDLDDTELGWGPWVMAKTNEALELIVKELEEKPLTGTPKT